MFNTKDFKNLELNNKYPNTGSNMVIETETKNVIYQFIILIFIYIFTVRKSFQVNGPQLHAHHNIFIREAIESFDTFD